MKNWFKKIKRLYKDRRFRKYATMDVQDIFSEIYDKNVWGGEKGVFYSGNGTTDARNNEYIAVVKEFIRSNNIKSIVEIGCGDFSIMRQLLAELPGIYYSGLDIVPALIKHHNETYQTSFISFQHLNAIAEDIPKGDLVIIRQVLQHLQNDQIRLILDKIAGFNYALITEHVASATDAEVNLDKVVGPHIRTRYNSGVFIDKPPFSVSNTSVLFEYQLDEKVKKKIIPAVIRTYSIKR